MNTNFTLFNIHLQLKWEKPYNAKIILIGIKYNNRNHSIFPIFYQVMEIKCACKPKFQFLGRSRNLIIIKNNIIAL